MELRGGTKSLLEGSNDQKEENKMRNIFGTKKRFQISLIAVCLGISLLSVGDIRAGKVTYVYDALNRLTRAIYDKTTFTYSYDKTGNRLTKIVILTKPLGTVDFDGDGKSDIAIYRASNGWWIIVPSSNPSAPYAVEWGGDPSDIPVTAILSTTY
jgi:hypothetical protein